MFWFVFRDDFMLIIVLRNIYYWVRLPISIIMFRDCCVILYLGKKHVDVIFMLIRCTYIIAKIY